MYSVFSIGNPELGDPEVYYQITFARKDDLLKWAKDKNLYDYKIYQMVEVNIETTIRPVKLVEAIMKQLGE